MASSFELLMKEGVHPKTLGRPEPRHERVELDGGIVLERDVAVPLRDGVKILVDIYRPAKGDSLPTVIEWSPYRRPSQDAR